MNISSPIGEIKGIGAKTEQLFHKLGVYTVGDILLHYPRDYEKLPPMQTADELAEAEMVRSRGNSGDITAAPAESEKMQSSGNSGDITVALAGRVDMIPLVRSTGRMQITTLKISEKGHNVSLVWFRMPYLKNTLKPGEHYVFLGKVTHKGNSLIMDQPQILAPEKYREMQNCLWPCYALTQGLSKNMVSKTVKQALEQLDLSRDYLPEDIRQRLYLAEYNYALENIHFPGSQQALEEARRRLVFDEFFQFILAAQLQKKQMERVANEFVFQPMENSWANRVMEDLPYELTNAQKRTLREVRENMRAPFIMQRLIQGDVGSGKTILAFLAMLDCSQSGCQSALMAPTEVLAKQHYETFIGLCETHRLKVPVILLTGSMTQKEKRRAYDRIQLYGNAMVIGTHALIQERTIFDNLALVITDEQHRFGVKQRETLYLKGSKPHILVMSATPIPRTLAIILYGDLDISVIDEVPARRLPIKNCVVNTSFRPKSYEFIRKEVEKGHQAYVICPLVEESEGLEAENVVDYTEKLKKELPGITVECLHGKMKGALKNQIMEAFAANEIQVLVSTTVIEVGVNVPNATVMMIEDAQRFGLAQLHQLRGRVGRGDAQSYCIMMNTSDNDKARKRLDILNRSNDGFFIASEDLKLRGPGDFFGIRQSGLLEFQLGDIYQDGEILKAASEEAKKLLQEDPQLEAKENESIRAQVMRYLDACVETANL